jgi:hypothetical protein
VKARLVRDVEDHHTPIAASVHDDFAFGVLGEIVFDCQPLRKFLTSLLSKNDGLPVGKTICGFQMHLVDNLASGS